MYLNSVLAAILSEKRTFVAEDVYKLNEAVFNLPEDDTVDAKLTKKLYDAVQKIVKAYVKREYDQSDPNFFYDYVALLSTMQNSHFFSDKQNKAMLSWLGEAVELDKGPRPQQQQEQTKPAASPQWSDKGTLKQISKLEDENRKMAEQIEKLRKISAAVEVIKNFKVPKQEKATEKAAGKGGKADRKGAAADSGKGSEVAEEKKAKTKSKGKSESIAEVKPVLDKMRALGRQLKEEGKSEDEIKEQLEPLKEELKQIKATARADRAKAREAAIADIAEKEA